MAKAIGIDIGSRSLKILEMELAGNLFHVKRFFNLEVAFAEDEPENMNFLAEPVRQIFREHRLEQSNIAISVPTQDCILREITMDFVHDEHIKKTIKYEAEKYLQSYPIEDVIIDFYKLQVISQNKSKVFFTAVPKKIIAERLNMLSNCDIDPMTIDIDIMALINLARLSPRVKSKETVVIIDFGAVSTKIAVLHQGELRYVRAIRVGAGIYEEKRGNDKKKETSETEKKPDEDEIDRVLEKQLIISLPVPDGIEMGRMVFVKKDKSDSLYQGPESQEKEQQLFTRLVREIRRTMLNLDLESPIELVCLTGGGSLIPGIVGCFEESFEIETILLDCPEKVRVQEELEEEVLTFGSVALGLAIELLDKNFRGMSFRKEEFQYTNRFELLKYPIATMVSLLFLLVLPWAYHFQNQRLQHQRQYKQLTDKAEQVWKRNFPDEALDADEFEIISTVTDKMDEEINERGAGDIPEVKNGFTRWKSIFEKIAAVRRKRYFTVTKFELDEERARFEGNMENALLLDDLKKEMLKIKDRHQNKDKIGGEDQGNNPDSTDARLKRRYLFEVTFSKEENDE